MLNTRRAPGSGPATEGGRAHASTIGGLLARAAAAFGRLTALESARRGDAAAASRAQEADAEAHWLALALAQRRNALRQTARHGRLSASRLALQSRARRRHGNAARLDTSRRRLGVIGSLCLAVFLVGAVVAGGGGLFGASTYAGYTEDMLPAEEMLATMSQGGARIYDRDGKLLYEFVDEETGMRRPVPLARVSPWMVQATIATEDPSFYGNVGLNVRGLARAAYENFVPSDDGFEFLQGTGGSSITQQLAKNVYISPELRSERSVERKVRETVIALELTRKYTKDQILEWYLNSISYGGMYVGVEAAAQGYFGKSARDLTLAEAALFAGIPQSPSRYSPLDHPDAAKARQRQVLELMVEDGAITPEQADKAAEQKLVFRERRFDIEAPHFVLNRVADEIRARWGDAGLYRGGLEVVTTLDLELQEHAQGILEHWTTEFEDTSGGRNGAMLVLDPHTGEILVYIGSRDYFRDDIQGRNNNITALNSPGSTLKPFTYMTAFMKGWGTGTGIIDAPITIKDPATGADFSPRNPIKQYQGVITAEKALGNSLNVTALKAILYAGVDDTLAVMRDVGFTTLDSPLGYGPALTLGGVDITLEDIVIGYSVLANGGVLRGQEAIATRHDPGERTIEPVALLRVRDPEGRVLYERGDPAEERVVDDAFPYLVTNILSNPNNHCIVFGACGALSIPGLPMAAKTGTSEPFEDSKHLIGETWGLGYTTELVAGVWYGNSNNAPMQNVYSTTVSWKVLRDFMTDAHKMRNLQAREFARPASVVEREVCYPSGRLPSPLCPHSRRYTSLFAESVLPKNDEEYRRMQDTWWRAAGGGLVALVLPRDETKEWAGGSLVVAAGLPPLLGGESGSPPGTAPAQQVQQAQQPQVAGAALRTSNTSNTSSYGPDVAPWASLTSPGNGASVSGYVGIRGSAISGNMVSYVVQVGAGGSWSVVAAGNQPVTATNLGGWDTRSFPNGIYTVRLVVTDQRLGTAISQALVTVQN